MTTGSSLLSTQVTGMITDFSSTLVPTVMGILVIVVPIGLTLWAIGFGIKKGLNYLKRSSSKAI